jgi:ABC-type transport system substrate-binding protein
MPARVPPAAPMRIARLAGTLVLTFAALAAVLVFCGWLLRPEAARAPISYPPSQLDEIKQLRDTSFDANHLPTIQRDVDYSQKGPWYPRQESPMLAELVQEGKLPPVEQRVGEEPLVLDGVDGIGDYGGTWVRVASSPSDVGIIANRLACVGLTRWSPLGYPVRPNVARAWTVSPDRREWTFYLRKGMKWSDGQPFTADDILFYWYEKKHVDAVPPEWMTVNGKLGDIVKVDDYTVKFVFPEPNGLLLEALTTNVCYTPQHYFAQYVPTGGNRELIKAAMRARGLQNPRALYSALKNFRNPEQPQIWPWIYRTYKASPPESFVRNPYFWAVDPQGHQLPYVDRILFEVKNPKLISIAASNGDVTMQTRYLTFDDYTMLMANREKNHYQVYHWFQSTRSYWTLWPNLNHRITPGDPESKWKAHFLNEKAFRQAL